MIDSADLVYSPEASATRYMYYQGVNDINIFVEDAGKEYEYETIFKRLLGDEYFISTIFAVGGKVKVEERFNEFGTESKENNEIKNIYVVDGDFDRYIYSEKMIVNPHFIYLKTYNIENYFLDEKSSIQFAKRHLKCLDNCVRENLDFINWKNTIIEQSSKLFLCYCFMKKFFPEEKTLSRSPYEFIDYKTGFERGDDSFEKYWKSILELDSQAQEKINIIKEIYIEINGEDYFNLICGKFLLESLYSHLSNIIGHKFNKEDFRWYLLCNFNVSELDYIKDRILSIMAS